ncbi:hypothetical protein [Enterobacter cloacae]|uniref:hypothetical protein n=1 Tax=Enterobacter cloacae TaxID=550 RepID=UPI0010100E74|nr:hypothetical protein [Enterobacter cloacae]HDC4839647.1 hypothetical protein [Enterobacter cloacae]
MNEHPPESPCLEEHFPIRDGLYVYHGNYIAQVPHPVNVYRAYKATTPTVPPAPAHSAHSAHTAIMLLNVKLITTQG